MGPYKVSPALRGDVTQDPCLLFFFHRPARCRDPNYFVVKSGGQKPKIVFVYGAHSPRDRKRQEKKKHNLVNLILPFTICTSMNIINY